MTIEEARKLMGDEAVKLTDQDIQKSIDTMHLLANLAIDAYLKLSPKERMKYKNLSNTTQKRQKENTL